MDEVPLVRLLSMALATALEDLHAGLAEAGHPNLRPAHGYALNAVMNGHDTASELGSHLGMTKQGAAKLLATLFEEGYLAESADASDGRRRPVRLTMRGREAVAESVRIQAEIELRWVGLVGKRRAAEMRTALTAVLGSRDGGMPHVRPVW